MPHQEVFASEIGRLAWELLSQPLQARVMGKTSRGLFLHLPPERLIFITLETFRGPLTLNLASQTLGAQTLGDHSTALERVSMGALASVLPGALHFPESALTILTRQALRWETPEPPLAAALSFARRRSGLAAVGERSLALRTPSPLGELLPGLLNPDGFSGLAQPAAFPSLAPLVQALRAGLPAAISQALEPLLGLGSGLTPSGDDLICGFLLALNRWGDVLAPGFLRSDLNQSIRSHAYRKTTLLSASLIDCASQGHADERLLQALVGIMSGVPEADACASLLAQWGNTSGLDALVGMALAINAPGSAG